MTNNPYKLGWIPDLKNCTTSKHVAIADALANDIKSGRLKAGTKLPPQRLLAYTLGLNLGTIHKAYQLAVTRGLITGEVGRGSYVKSQSSSNVSWPNENPYDRAIDFCDNFPCLSRKVTWLQKELVNLKDTPYLSQLLQYQQDSAFPAHKQTGCDWLMRFGVEAKPENIIITSGALHAGFISLLTLCRPGDLILTEEFTSQAIRSTANRLKLRVRGIKMDRKGIIPDHLEELLRKEIAAAVYLVPTLHNPTATILSVDRRRKVAAILLKHGVPLIEDDIFANLPDDLLPPISTLMPDLSFYIASLSKTIAPALRLAYLKIPPKFYQDVLANLRITTWLASPILAELAGNLIARGEADNLIKEQKLEIGKRQKLAAKILKGFDVSTHPYAFHVWLKLPEPWRAASFMEVLRKKEVLVLSSDSFAVDRGNPTHAIRVCLGTPPTYSQVSEGLQIIRETLNNLSSVG